MPGESGFLGRLAPRGQLLTMRAGTASGSAAVVTKGALGYAAQSRGRHYRNPTLVLQRGERVRIQLVNALSEPTIIHWHGLTPPFGLDGNPWSQPPMAPGKSVD